jgi:hypothetical protein
MRVFGIDFTSAPDRRKPITCVSTQLIGETLTVEHNLELVSLTDFESFLARPGPWLAGFDFPFGQARKLIEQLNWPNNWAGYVHHISAMGQKIFEDTLTRYRQQRPSGDKHHRRVTDKLAKSVSPMMLHGVPVGKMFFQGAPRLLRSEVSILPCRPNADPRIALEAYPALVARKWLGRRSYKSDNVAKQTATREVARRDLVGALRSDQLHSRYGLRLELSEALADQLIQDAKADKLDAILCAIQAAWAHTHRPHGYGIPDDCDPLEGWIVDPELL